MSSKFSVFQDVRATDPKAAITAEQLIRWIRGDDQKGLVDLIRSAPDKDTRSRYKARLPAVTASGEFSRRSASALIEHSGLLIADVDLEENPQLFEEEQMASIWTRLCADEKVHFLFVSPSGGLKVGVKINSTCAASHKAAFESVRDLLLEKHALVIDKACSDVSRLCFLSHDPNAHFNPAAGAIETTIQEAPELPAWDVRPQSKIGERSVGDHFSQECDIEGLLQSQGWTTRNGRHWTRPNKSGGISGTLGVVGERKFYCWTSSAAPLEANTSYSPFALFAAFYHGGDFTAAAADLADQGFGESEREPLPAGVVKTIDQMVTTALAREADSWLPPVTPAEVAKADIEAEVESLSFVDTLKLLTASTEENIAAMKQRATDAVFVLPQVALMGDCTILNAGPNTGKTLLTLWMLCHRDFEATKHLNIFYINADDSFNGGIEKMELTRHLGIHHLIPNQNGFDPADFSKIIKAAIKADECGKMVIILDTLKKFVSTMDKNDARIFNMMVRAFTQAGGTLIALAHTNKNKDADGKSVAEGVGDFQSDFDCAYTIDVAPVLVENGDRTIVFRNTKLRGPNSMKVSFTYDAGERKTWEQRFASVKSITEEETKIAEQRAQESAQLEIDQPIIDYLNSQLEDGAKSHSALSQNNLGGGTGSRGERNKVLERYEGKFWGRSRGATGGWNFHKLAVGNLVRFGV